MADIVVIDYGMGNLRSVAKALLTVAGKKTVAISADPNKIRSAKHVVLPGVGAIGDCMLDLERRQLTDVVINAMKNQLFLGICLGMQALFDNSEENHQTALLQFMPGQVRHFNTQLDTTQPDRKVPHMGWNQVKHDLSHPIWASIPQHSHFYFVHSYYVVPDNQTHTIATTDYQQPFTSAVGTDNVVAVQFHPEKSQEQGLQLLNNFIHWHGKTH